MREVIVGFRREAKRSLDTLLLLGEGAGHSEFVKTVQEALLKLYPGSGPGPSVRLWEQGDPLHVAARGAAEFAKRAQASPPNCRKPARCFENREIDNSQGGLSDEL